MAMVRSVYLASIAAVLFIHAAATATDVSGDQSGTWTPAGSPYRLVGDVRVPPGATLTIEPDVVVIGMGQYKITVERSTLIAVGTAGQPILMTADNQSTGWRGLRFEDADPGSTVQHCIIEYARGTGGYPEVRGGAIYLNRSSITVADNELRFCYSRNSNSNGAGGGVCSVESSPTIVRNFIHDNNVDSGGGVLCIEYGTALIADNLIVDNVAGYAGGGIYCGARSSPLIERNVIMRNRAGGWGGGGINFWTAYIFYQTFATARDNIIAENTATTDGGGVYARYDKTVLYNNTIAGNSARRGGGIYALNQGSSPPEVANCILWNNSAGQGPQVFLEASTGSTIGVRFSDVQGGYPGPGNIPDDPRFVGGTPYDYHLQADSPCKDAGDPAFVPASGETDIDGQPRVVCEGVDVGADEVVTPGDLNGDGLVDLADLGVLLADFGCSVGDCPGDIDGDGDTDLADLGILLANFGRGC